MAFKNQPTPILSRNYYSSSGVGDPFSIICNHFTQNISNTQHRSWICPDIFVSHVYLTIDQIFKYRRLWMVWRIELDVGIPELKRGPKISKWYTWIALKAAALDRMFFDQCCDAYNHSRFWGVGKEKLYRSCRVIFTVVPGMRVYTNPKFNSFK